MFLFDMPIAPWHPADSIAVIKLMAVQMMSQIDREVLRARLSLALPDKARLADILPDAPGTGIGALPDYAALMPGADTLRFAGGMGGAANDPLSPFRGPGLANASNGWAAAPSRSASGGTLLANDPHLGFSAPSIWYLARLELSSGGVIGGTIPGMPLVLSGRSDRLGWGLTSSYLDDLDVMIEESQPRQPRAIPHPRRLPAVRDPPLHHRDQGQRAGHPHPALERKRPGPARLPCRSRHHHPPGHVAAVSGPRSTIRTRR